MRISSSVSRQSATKAGRDDEEALFALGGKAAQLVVGVRLQPGFADETRLEGNGIAGGVESGTARQGLRRAVDLRPVAGGLGGAAGVAAIGDQGAVGPGGISLAQVPDGNAMKTEKKVVVRLGEVRVGPWRKAPRCSRRLRRTAAPSRGAGAGRGARPPRAPSPPPSPSSTSHSGGIAA